jgi:hypothetical protein
MSFDDNGPGPSTQVAGGSNEEIDQLWREVCGNVPYNEDSPVAEHVRDWQIHAFRARAAARDAKRCLERVQMQERAVKNTDKESSRST